VIVLQRLPSKEEAVVASFQNGLEDMLCGGLGGMIEEKFNDFIVYTRELVTETYDTNA
jgi:hypothetical protein